MPVIKPITELRNTNEISELCHQQQEPIFITKNGFGDLVVMSIEAIHDAEQEVAEGAELLDAKEALATLRRKHFG